jgi:hypothetical protein
MSNGIVKRIVVFGLHQVALASPCVGYKPKPIQYRVSAHPPLPPMAMAMRQRFC